MKLLNQLLLVARRKRLADATVDAYTHWIKDFLRFSASLRGVWKHPADLGTADVEAFLNDLVIRRQLSASSQNQSPQRAGVPLRARPKLTALGISEFGVRGRGLRRAG